MLAFEKIGLQLGGYFIWSGFYLISGLPVELLFQLLNSEDEGVETQLTSYGLIFY